MKAVVFHGVGDIRLDEVPEPKIKDPTDTIVKLTASAICGTDLHMVRGSFPGMVPGTILGHEGVGVVEAVGKEVRNFKPGDRVVIPSTINCGYCSYCRSGYPSQCDNSNPNGKTAGTAFFGGPKESGPFEGLQAEYARIPFSAATLIRLPNEVDDDRAILLSDIFPTAWFGAELAEITPGDSVAIFGAGPVGLFAVVSAFLKGANRVFIVDRVADRLEMARELGAEPINFDEEHPVEAIKSMTGGIGVDRVIDAVGVDARAAQHGPALAEARLLADQHKREVADVAPKTNPGHGQWEPGDAPSQALLWGASCLAKAGTLGIIGVYPDTMQSFPVGIAVQKNLTIKMGNCPHRRIIPDLLGMVRPGRVDPLKILTKREPMTSVIDAYKAFDLRQPGWIKVELRPSA